MHRVCDHPPPCLHLSPSSPLPSSRNPLLTFPFAAPKPSCLSPSLLCCPSPPPLCPHTPLPPPRAYSLTVMKEEPGLGAVGLPMAWSCTPGQLAACWPGLCVVDTETIISQKC